MNVLKEFRELRELYNKGKEEDNMFPFHTENLRKIPAIADRLDKIEHFCRERTEGAVGWAYKEILAMLRGEE